MLRSLGVTTAQSRILLVAVITLSLILTGFLLLRVGSRQGASPTPNPDPAHDVAALADRLSPDGPYEVPSRDQRQEVAKAVLHFADGTGDAAAAPLDAVDYSVREGVDPVTGRRYAIAVDQVDKQRGWGLVLRDLTTDVRRVVEVPHPRSDMRSEELGLALFREQPGTLLMMAGAHRRAANGAADVAHRADSVFDALARGFARRGMPQVQVHGFDDDSAPGHDVVLSEGSGTAGPAAHRVGDSVEAAGFAVCRAWKQDCAKLEGTQNVQARAAAELGGDFLHVEVSHSVRDDPRRRAELVRALAVV
jgi:hypothetical protein